MRARLIAGDKQIYLIAVFALLIGFFIFKIPANFATADANSWASSDPTVEVGRDATSEDIRSPRTCYTESWQYYSYTNAQNNQSNTPRLLTVDECAVNGVGKNYVHAGYAYLRTGNNYIYGIPNNNNVLVSERSYTGDTALGIESGLATAGVFKAPQPSNTNVGEYKPNPPARPYNDSLGRTISFNYNNWSFSPNGKYMIAEVLYHGLVKIDIETEEITLFSNQTYTYGMGYNPTPQLGISNDGQTAVVANFEGGALNIYDLTGCTTKVITATNNVATGCASPRNIQTLVKSKVPGYLIMNGIRFSDNDKSIYGVSYRKDPTTNQFKYQKITLNMAGYAPQPVNYIAMGDSFASGEGDMDGRNWYEDGTDTSVNKCHLSKRSYPYLLSQYLDNKEFHSVACSGAEIKDILDVSKGYKGQTTDNTPKEKRNSLDILTNYKPGYLAQVEFINSSKPSYVTISVGGNNVGFTQKLTACVTSDYRLPLADTCKYADNLSVKAGVAKEIADQYDILKASYTLLKEKTNDETKIYVTGYPQFIKPVDGNCGNNVHLNDKEREFVYESVKYMNQVIKSASVDAGVYYLDIEDTLAGRNLCSGATDSSMAVNGLTEGDDELSFRYVASNGGGKLYVNNTPGLGKEAFHPNQKAQPFIRDRILQLTNNNPASFVTCPAQPDRNVCDTKKGKIPEPKSAYFGADATAYIKSKNAESTQIFPLVMQQKQMVFEDSPLDRTKILLDRLQPYSPVGLKKYSNPVDLGTYYADATGKLEITLDLSKESTPGTHELHAFTKNIAGESQEFYQHIFVTGQEGDVNGNNIPDVQEKCGFVPDSGIDYDKDGADDACDGFISDPPPPVADPAPIVIPDQTPTEVIQPTEDPNKIPLGESVAGFGDEIVFSAIATETQPQLEATNNDAVLVAGLNQVVNSQPAQIVTINTNSPQASSNLSDNFSNSIAKNEKVQKIIPPKTKPNYMLVLIISLGILLLTIIKLTKVKNAKEKKE